jgi:hypothetical protein
MEKRTFLKSGLFLGSAARQLPLLLSAPQMKQVYPLPTAARPQAHGSPSLCPNSVSMPAIWSRTLTSRTMENPPRETP